MGKIFNTSFSTEKEYSLWKAIIKQITKCDLKTIFNEDSFSNKMFNHDRKKGLIINAK